MSSFRVISEVSKLLQTTLLKGFSSDPDPAHHPGPDGILPAEESSIVLMNPADAAEDANQKLSIWLYSVQINEHLRNIQPLRVPNDNSRVQYPPLAVNLFYLITPFTKTDHGDQWVL